jgi:hypothetical protein
MFAQKFRVILYKMFVQSSLEFCSTLFFDLKSSSETDETEYLNIKLCKTMTIQIFLLIFLTYI